MANGSGYYFYSTLIYMCCLGHEFQGDGNGNVTDVVVDSYCGPSIDFILGYLLLRSNSQLFQVLDII